MKLIDADAMNEELFYKQVGGKDSLITAESAFEMINAQPTAYDPDKVVEKLEAYSNADEAERLGTMPVVELTDAITIVKGGGVDAKTDS